MTADSRTATTASANAAAVADFRAQARWRWYEPLFWLGAIAWYFLFPTYLSLGTQILCAALFALSLDLILGYGGIVSLGHTTFFGIGAYTAGLLAKHGWGEPITCLLAGGVTAAIAGWICSFVIVRVQGVALLLVTLGINLVLYETANKAYTITGGADGLQGIAFWKLLGVFDYDIFGRVAYIYTLIVTFLLFLVARRIVHSPFGLALKGMRENWKRMPALGAALRRHGALIFVLSAALAGLSGALLAESVQFVALVLLRRAALGRRADHADCRWHRSSLRQLRRRHRLHGGARPTRRSQPRLLVFLDRPDPGRNRIVHPQWAGWRGELVARRVTVAPTKLP